MSSPEADDMIRFIGGQDHVRAERSPSQTPCPLCDDVGFTFRVDEQGYQVADPCRCQTLDRTIKIIANAQLPGRYAHKTFETYTPLNHFQGRAWAAARQFVAEFTPGQPGLMFYGEPGVGKTHLMVAALRALVVSQGVRVRFVEFVHLLADLRAGFNTGKNPNDLMAPLAEVPVLAVDELGKGRGTEWSLGVLDELISKRYNAGRTTLFTTNYYPKNKEGRPALVDRVGERIYSRLQEMCALHRVAGDDYRRRLADAY